jgi:hypothetical protein
LFIVSEVLDAKREAVPAEPAEHRILNDSRAWEGLYRDFERPIVAVSNNSRYVNFWKMVCGDGTNFASLIEAGGKRFCSPWAGLGFRGLLKALVASAAEPEDGDMEFLEMQEALDDYIVCHGLVDQAQSAARLASRLPWLVKYKYIDTMPQPVHSADLLCGSGKTTLLKEDITFSLPPRFSIATLLLVGHLMETCFVHWMTQTLDLKVAQESLGAGFRKIHHLWESPNYAAIAPVDADGMKEIIEVGDFLGHVNYTLPGDPKFRKPGVNTSYWEAALVGPVPGTAAHVVLSAQRPDTSIVSGTVIGVSSAWFAKIRASNLFESRKFEVPYDDFPFPSRQVPQSVLTDVEHRLAYAQERLPQFELDKIHFGRTRPVSSYKQLLLTLMPFFPPRGGLRLGGKFDDAYFSTSKDKPSQSSNVEKIDSERTRTQHATRAEKDDTEDGAGEIGWRLVEPEPVDEGNMVIVPAGSDTALQAFVDALRASGIAADLESVKDMAGSRGWDEGDFVPLHLFGYLCQHYQVGMILESEALGSFKFSLASDTTIHILYSEKKQEIGWVRQIERKKRADFKKGVHFTEGT